MKSVLFVIACGLLFLISPSLIEPGSGMSVALLYTGLLVGGALVLFWSVFPHDLRLLKNTKNLLWFLWDFIWDLTLSNLRLAWDVLTPKNYHYIRLVRIPVSDLTPGEIALLSHRITLTPGTLTCGVDEDRGVLLVHAMYPDKSDAAAALRRPIDILKGQA
ncbi:MAG: Na+/H+ antiporter subunit E [Sumerlaeia bacterium]